MYETRREDHTYYFLWFVQAVINVAWKLTLFALRFFWWLVKASAECLFYFTLFCVVVLTGLLKSQPGRRSW